MRVLRTSLAMASVLGFAPALAVAQYNPQSLLTGNVPVFRGVEYDFPADKVKGDDPAVKAAVDACKVEASKQGFIVRDAQNKLLRRFIDTNAKKTQRERREGSPARIWTSGATTSTASRSTARWTPTRTVASTRSAG